MRYWVGIVCVFALNPWELHARPPLHNIKLHVIISHVVTPVIDDGIDSYLINLESLLLTNIEIAVLLSI